MMNGLYKKHYLVGLLVFWIVFQSIQLNGVWTRMDDDAHYLLHAQSLVVNHRYNDPNFIYSPDVHYIPKNTSPGWPLMLVPFLLLFGKNLLVLKSVIILFALFSGFLIYHILKERLMDDWISLLITGIYFFSMTTIVFTKVIYSEWPYMLISYLMIYLLVKEKWELTRYSHCILIGLCLGVLLLIRFVAVSLFFAVIAVIVQGCIVREHKFLMGIKRIGIVFLTAVVVYQAVYLGIQPEKGPGYKEQFFSKDLFLQDRDRATFTDVLERIPKNGNYFIKRIVPVFLGRNWHESITYRYPGSYRLVDGGLFIAGCLTSLLIFLGFVLQFVRQKPTVMEYYVLFYMALMSIIWFHTEVYRYIMPIASFLLYYFLIGVSCALQSIYKIREMKRPILLSMLAVLLVINICHAGVEIYRYRFAPRSEKTVFASNLLTVEWLIKNVKSDELIIADDPRWYALETQLPVAPFLRSKDIEAVYRYIAQFPGAVVVFDQNRRFQNLCFLPVLQQNQGEFKLLQTFDHIHIYRYNPEFKDV